MNKFEILTWNDFLIMKRFGIFMIWNESRYLNFLELKKLECYQILSLQNIQIWEPFSIITLELGLRIFMGLQS